MPPKIKKGKTGGGGGRPQPPSPPPTFEEGEVVNCEFKGRLYQARILKIERGSALANAKMKNKLEKDKMYYNIHYLKWSKKWDEWVGDERLVKLGGVVNVKEQKKAKKETKTKKVKAEAQKPQNKASKAREVQLEAMEEEQVPEQKHYNDDDWIWIEIAPPEEDQEERNE